MSYFIFYCNSCVGFGGLVASVGEGGAVFSAVGCS